MRILLLAVAALASACARDSAARDSAQGAASQAGSSDTARVGFEVELWPGEGIPVFQSVSEQLVLRERPLTSADTAHVLRVPRGERLTYDSTRYRTVAPATLRVLTPGEIRGRSFGAVDRLTRDDYYSGRFSTTTVRVDSTSRLELLQHRAEGRCFVRLDREVLQAERCPTLRAGFALEREPETQWWIHVTGTDGNAGWLLVADTTARVVERTF